jgi:hypothetical protein
MSFSGSVQLPLALTVSGAGPELGATLSAHVGGWFCVLCASTFCVAEPVRPAESVAVTVTV